MANGIPRIEVEISADPNAAVKGFKEVTKSVALLDAATDRYEKQLRDLDRAQSSGLLSAQKYAKQLAVIEKEYVDASKAAAAYGGGTVSVRRATEDLGQAFVSTGGTGRMLTQQLSQVAQQTAATGQPIQALAVQAADIGLAFGTVGTVVGALAGLALPALMVAFAGTASAADNARKSIEDIDNVSLSSVRSSVSNLVSIQESFNDAVKGAGAASGGAASLVIANSEKEFKARQKVLSVELQILKVRKQEQIAELQNLRDVQEQTRQGALDTLSDLGPGATSTGLEGLEGIVSPRFDIESLDRTVGGYLGDLKSNRLAIDKLSAELELLGIAEDEATNAINSAFGELDGGDSGDGGGKGKTRAGQLAERLLGDLQTQREALTKWREDAYVALEAANAAELEAVGGHAEAKLRIEEEYQKRLSAIRQAEQATTLNSYGTLFGNLASTFQSGSGKLLKLSKAFSVAQGLINSYRAYTEVLADPSLIGRPFLRTALAASTLASGLAQVANIKSVSESGGGSAAGGGAATGATASVPSQNIVIDLVGDTFSRNSVSSLFDQINEGYRNGLRIEGISVR